MSSIEAGHGLRSVHMTLERDFDIERMEFDSVLDYLLPTILLLMIRIRFLRAALERQALDWPSALILLFLLVDGHAIAIGELAQALDLSTSTVSTTARKLEARGFTFYSEVPGDRRIVQVSLTTAGTEAAERALDCLAQEFREQFSLDPGLDPEEGFSESAYGQHSYAIMAGGPCTADVLWLLSHFQASLVMLQRHIGTIKGCTDLAFLMLIVLYRTGGSSPSNLSRALVVDRSTASRALRFLLGEELATRTRGSDDRRSVVVRVSEKGIALLERIIPQMHAEIVDTSPLGQATSFAWFADFASAWIRLRSHGLFDGAVDPIQGQRHLCE